MSQHSDHSANKANTNASANKANPQGQPHAAANEVETLWVELAERRYPIYIGKDVGTQSRQKVHDDGHSLKSCAVIVDQEVLQKHDFIRHDYIPLNVSVNGETAKSMEKLGEIYDALAERQIGRDGALIAIGGGVTGDLAGFAAATYLRGIDFYQMPTTLLAMVDSSVGGKTGINIAAGKNLVGAFWQPKAVFINTSFLATLPPREFSAGMAEVIKYGMLYDAAFFKELVNHVAGGRPLTWDHPALPKVIRRCCEIKAAIVGEDERETSKEGGRALLNLGHTFAHAIENAAGYGTYLHGEAVGIGLVMAARLSEELTRRGEHGYHFTAQDVERVRALVQAYHLPTALNQPLGAAATSHAANSHAASTNTDDATAANTDGRITSATPAVTADSTPQLTPPPLSLEKLQQAMGRDKKVEGGTIRFVAMQRIGVAIKTHGVDAALIDSLWHEFGAS